MAETLEMLLDRPETANNLAVMFTTATILPGRKVRSNAC